jgi:signal-transduction protein with cAMP-binding, CBS, and nucleotidyltransferase domain
MVDEERSVKQAASIMARRGVGSLLVTQKSNPVGIVTEWDVLSKVAARGRDSATVKVKEIMSKPLITIRRDATMGEAIALMAKHHIRRLAVVSNGNLVGVLTQNQIVGDRREDSSPLPMLQPKHGVTCPYCSSTFEQSDELSKHIDRVHIGLGLLEGNLRKW